MRRRCCGMVVAMVSLLSTDALAQQSGMMASRGGLDWPTQKSVKYFDPLYHYSLTIPKGWYISPTPANAVYGAAVFYNYEPDSFERAYTHPSNALKVQIGVAPLATGQDFQSWMAKWTDLK